MGVFYILEFGGQHTDLIGDRLESMGHTARYSKSNTPAYQIRGADGIILSGGPKSVYESGTYPYDPKIFTSGKPILGICYGMQLMANEAGGSVSPNGREYGESRITKMIDHPLFKDMPSNSIVWMNHGDYVSQTGDFQVLAMSDKGLPSAIARGNNVAVQFHPELTHTEYGMQILRNFTEGTCGSVPIIRQSEQLNENAYIQNAIDEIRSAVGRRKAVVYLSGGVDSTVAYRLALASGVDVIGVHLDMGIERKNEAANVKQYLDTMSRQEVFVYNTAGRTLEGLYGLSDPEDKRRTFQRLYNQTLDEILPRMGLDKSEIVFVQGTLATDRRESGKEAAKKKGRDAGTVATIKTHHNVSDRDVAVVEPLKYLSKDGARRVARALGLDESIVNRQPFPGPGLSIRLITGIYPYEHGLAGNVYDTASKHGYAGYVLPVKTVGLKGDDRSFEHLALIVGEKDWTTITRTQKDLAEELPINRTVYLHSSWIRGRFDGVGNISRSLEFIQQNIRMLQEATYIAERSFEEYGVRPAQLPVTAFQGPNGPWIAVRDVDSVDFRSVRPLRKPDEMPWELCDAIANRILSSPDVRRYGDVEAVVFDVSTKPAATTEWE